MDERGYKPQAWIKATTVTAIINNIKPSRVLMSSRMGFTLAPIFLGFSLDCWRFRVLDLDPMC
jgi:hypothetical protein